MKESRSVVGIALVTLALAALAAPQTSWAQVLGAVPPAAGPPTASDAADYALGIAALHARHWEEARAIFQSLHARQPTPRSAYGLGVALYGLQHYMESARLLEIGLAGLGDGTVTAASLDETRRMLETARQQVAHLSLRGLPAGAVVAVDGQPAAPVGGEITLDPGRHSVSVAAEGYQPDSQSIVLTPRERMVLAVSPSHQPRLVVEAGLSNAVILVDGNRQGVGTATLRLAPGAHLVTVQASGCTTIDRRVELHDNDTVRLALSPVCNRWVLPTAIGGGIALAAAAVALGVVLARGDAAPTPGTWQTFPEPGH